MVFTLCSVGGQSSSGVPQDAKVSERTEVGYRYMAKDQVVLQCHPDRFYIFCSPARSLRRIAIEKKKKKVNLRQN